MLDNESLLDRRYMCTKAVTMLVRCIFFFHEIRQIFSANDMTMAIQAQLQQLDCVRRIV